MNLVQLSMDLLRLQLQGLVTSQPLIQRDQDEQQLGLVLEALMMGIQGIYRAFCYLSCDLSLQDPGSPCHSTL